MRRAAILTLALAAIAAGCGESDDVDANYVSLEEASAYLTLTYGGDWRCAGREPPDILDAEPAGPVFGFAACRLLSPATRPARSVGLERGAVVTYGIP